MFSSEYAHVDHSTHPRVVALHATRIHTQYHPNVAGEVESRPSMFSRAMSWLTSSDFSDSGLSQTVRVRVTEARHAVEDGETRLPHVVHLGRVFGDEEKAELVAQLETVGVSLGPYLPHHSYLVHCSEATARAVQALDAVAWVGEFAPDYKMTDEVAYFVDLPADVQDGLAEDALPDGAKPGTTSKHRHGTRLYVLLVPGSQGHVSEEGAARVAERIQARMGPGVSVSVISAGKLQVESESVVTGADVAGAAVDPDVLHIEFAPQFALRNKFARWITQSRQPGVTPVTDKGLEGLNEIVHVADSGLDYDNCLFADPSVSSPGPTHRKVIKYDIAPGNDGTDDVSGHGTHVCGSVLGATMSSSDPIYAHRGQAPKAKLYFTDIGETGGGLSVPGNLNTGLFPAPYDAGAKISSNSWGSASPAYTSSAAEVDEFMANHDDFVVLVAAGNDGASPDSISNNVGSPATSKSCISVGASQTSNAGFVEGLDYYDWAERQQVADEAGISDCCTANKAAQDYCCQSKMRENIVNNPSRWDLVNVAPFSSRGPTTDGRLKPDIMFPGDVIVSAHSDGPGDSAIHCGTMSPALDNPAALLSMSGTSMATPTGAGISAVVREYYLNGYYPSGSANAANARTPSGALVKATLVAAGVPLRGEIDLGNNGTYIRLGAIPSIFQGFGVVQMDTALKFDSSSHNLWVDDSTTSSTGSTNNYCIQGASSGSDLKATLVWSDKPGSPSSGVALVNDLTLFMGTDDNTVTGNWRNKKDTRNTVEVATIAASQISSGTEYKIQVKGVNVPSGPQKYALVITGSFTSVSTSGCTYEFADNFEDQSDSESFPLGPAVGIGAAGLAGGLLVMLSLLFFKDKTTLPRLCAAFQGAQGGGGH